MLSDGQKRKQFSIYESLNECNVKNKIKWYEDDGESLMYDIHKIAFIEIE